MLVSLSLPSLPVDLRSSRVVGAHPHRGGAMCVRVLRSRGDDLSAVAVEVVEELEEQTPQGGGGELDRSNMFLLLRCEMDVGAFQGFRQREALLVDFPAFHTHVVDLLGRCRQGGGQFRVVVDDDERDPGLLRMLILESTAFRDLTHLSLPLTPATDGVTIRHLAERLRHEARRVLDANERVAVLTAQVQSRDETVKRVTEEMAAVRRAVDAERLELLHSDDKRRQEALREARSMVSEEERQRRDRAEARVVELEAKLRVAEEETAKAKAELARAEASATRATGATDANIQLRAEANTLRERVRELESRALEETSRSARLQERVQGLERELAAREAVVAKSNELLEAERAAVQRLERSIQSESATLDSLLRSTQDSASLLDSLRGENESLKSKIATKNLVLRQQETVVRDRTSELERLRVHVGELDRDLAAERARTQDLQGQVSECKSRLQESAEALDANTKVISFLSKELHDRERVYGYGSGGGGSEWTRFHDFRPEHVGGGGV